ncbi:MAG: NADH:flavin oxidoreductase [Candidatus Omnitrophica bacterium]|nr:NADH:flavin oxidoreductase [Candidatus Omnitrophota bacterium]
MKINDVFDDQETNQALAPVTAFGRNLRNRTVVAPMTRISATQDGLATERMKCYYGDYARGGFGMVITEGTYTDLDASQGYTGQPGIATAIQAEAWRGVAEEIHSGSALAIMQLMHAGALSQHTAEDGRRIAPSAIQPLGRMMPAYGGDGLFPIPWEMSENEIQSVRKGFVDSARRARDAGFDGVEIHAANGYLLDQFNTTYTNHRVDRYGGSPENRIRFTAEIVANIRSTAPEDFIVGVRVSEAKVNDHDYRWPGGAGEATILFHALAEAGASYLHIAGEGRGFRETLKESREPYTALARRLTGLPVIANGGAGDPDLANNIIREGYADFVAMGRAALANPDWPVKVANDWPLVGFDPEMVSPHPTIAVADAWFERNGATDQKGFHDLEEDQGGVDIPRAVLNP